MTQRKRVFVVEDERDLAEIVAELFLISGAEVRVAHDGKTFFEECLSFIPDLVILDIELPDISGRKIATTIRTMFPAAVTPFIAAHTGTDSEKEDDVCFDAFLQKPCNPQDLIDLLETTSLERRERERRKISYPS